MVLRLGSIIRFENIGGAAEKEAQGSLSPLPIWTNSLEWTHKSSKNCKLKWGWKLKRPGRWNSWFWAAINLHINLQTEMIHLSNWNESEQSVWTNRCPFLSIELWNFFFNFIQNSWDVFIESILPTCMMHVVMTWNSSVCKMLRPDLFPLSKKACLWGKKDR